MDLLLNEYVDQDGRNVIDFDFTNADGTNVLPVRNGIWYTGEMSEPERFVSATNGVLTITDPIALVAASRLFMTTETAGVGVVLTTIDGDEEIKQRAVVASMLQRGTIPSMPETGNYTAELLAEDVAPSVYNAKLMQNIQDLANTLSYRPVYKYSHNTLEVEVVEV